MGSPLTVFTVEGELKHVHIESGSFAFELTIDRFGRQDYLKLLKLKKWSQDGKFHPDKGLTMLLEDAKTKFLPALAELLDRQLV